MAKNPVSFLKIFTASILSSSPFFSYALSMHILLKGKGWE